MVEWSSNDAIGTVPGSNSQNVIYHILLGVRRELRTKGTEQMDLKKE